MTGSEVAIHFTAKKARKGAWVAKCPCHDDRSRNTLAIKEGNKGVLVHCWAGCPKEAVLAAVGLRFRDLFYSSRDVSSEALKQIRRQQTIDRAYAAEVRRQDLLLWLTSLECKWKPVRTPDRFERDIKTYANRICH